MKIHGCSVFYFELIDPYMSKVRLVTRLAFLKEQTRCLLFLSNKSEGTDVH